MALVTEDGSASADSYGTAAESVTYITAKYPSDTEWAALETAEQEFRLEVAALLMNTLPLRGAKACREQALEFPRWWRTDDGYPITEDDYLVYADIASANYTPPTTPTHVKNAQIELAYHYVHNGVLQMEPLSNPEREISSFSLAGSLTIEFSESRSGLAGARFSKPHLSSLDIMWAYMNKWIRQVSGGVV